MGSNHSKSTDSKSPNSSPQPLASASAPAIYTKWQTYSGPLQGRHEPAVIRGNTIYAIHISAEDEKDAKDKYHKYKDLYANLSFQSENETNLHAYTAVEVWDTKSDPTGANIIAARLPSIEPQTSFYRYFSNFLPDQKLYCGVADVKAGAFHHQYHNGEWIHADPSHQSRLYVFDVSAKQWTELPSSISKIEPEQVFYDGEDDDEMHSLSLEEGALVDDQHFFSVGSELAMYQTEIHQSVAEARFANSREFNLAEGRARIIVKVLKPGLVVTNFIPETAQSAFGTSGIQLWKNNGSADLVPQQEMIDMKTAFDEKEKTRNVTSINHLVPLINSKVAIASEIEIIKLMERDANNNPTAPEKQIATKYVLQVCHMKKSKVTHQLTFPRAVDRLLSSSKKDQIICSLVRKTAEEHGFSIFDLQLAGCFYKINFNLRLENILEDGRIVCRQFEGQSLVILDVDALRKAYASAVRQYSDPNSVVIPVANIIIEYCDALVFPVIPDFTIAPNSLTKHSIFSNPDITLPPRETPLREGTIYGPPNKPNHQSFDNKEESLERYSYSPSNF